MSGLSPIVNGILADYVLRGASTTHSLRPQHPGVNQSQQDAIAGLGSADHEGPHGND